MQKKTKNKIYLCIYIFLYLFAPPFIPQMNIFLAAISLLILSFFYEKDLINCVKKSASILFITVIVIFLIFIIYRRMINYVFYNDVVQTAHYKSLYNRFIVAVLTIVPCSNYVIIFSQKHKFDMNDFWEVLFGAGVIEAALCFISLLSPSVKNIFIHIMNRSSSDVNTWYITVRSFGFARTLTDVFGWGTGIIAGLALMYGVFYKRRFIGVSVILLISPLLNARTGLVFYVIAACIILLYLIIKMKTADICRIAVIGGTMAILATILWKYILENYGATAQWIAQGVEDILDILNGSSSREAGFGHAFFNRTWWELPKGLRLVLGTGHSRYGAEGYLHSDFGYVNDIWAGGLLGSTLLYGGILLIFKKTWKKIHGIEKIMLLYVFSSIFIFNVKGCAVSYNSGFAVVMLVVLYINYYVRSDRGLVYRMEKSLKCMRK